MAFEHIMTVRFNEVDRAGIAFFGRVYEYCHAAFEELLMASGSSLTDVFERGGWGMPLVHSEADYARPMRLGERLTVELTVPEIGQTSITFGYRVIGEDGKLRCTCKLVHVIVNLDTFEPRDVPEQLLRTVKELGLRPDDEALSEGT